ncbi:MAG: hypothetical protein WA981_03655 [Glaciecola sp.]
MTKLITATQKHFGGELLNGGLKFSFGEDEYVLTDSNRLYAFFDGRMQGLGHKVGSLLKIENHVAEMAE